MERQDYFNMVKKALTTLKSTRGSFYDIWCYIKDHFRIKADTKMHRHVEDTLKSGVKEGIFQEYVCRGRTRFKLNMDKKGTTTKCRSERGKGTTKTPKERQTGVDQRNIKRKNSSSSSRPKKKIKSQTTSGKLASAIDKKRATSKCRTNDTGKETTKTHKERVKEVNKRISKRKNPRPERKIKPQTVSVKLASASVKKRATTKCRTNTEKGTIKTLKERGAVVSITSLHTIGRPGTRSGKRKASSPSSRSRKMVKSQTVSSNSATAIEETQSDSRDNPALVLHRSFTVKLPDDRWDSTIISIDVTPDGRILVVDRRIKLFDKDGNILDTFKINLFNGPSMVVAINNNEAACTVTPDSEIYILDIKDNKLAFKNTVRVIPRCWLSGISVHSDKFIVVNETRPMSVQLIDRQGKIYWSTQRDDNGEPLVRNQILLRLTGFIEEGKLRVVIVDVRDNRLIKLDGDTGKVVNVTKLSDTTLMAPAEITHDTKNRLYVSNSLNGEIYAWNYQLTDCTMVLSKATGLRDKPWRLKYDASNDQLLVSYGHNSSNVIDIFHAV